MLKKFVKMLWLRRKCLRNIWMVPKYYALCGFGGLLSCGITHTAVTPLDLVKCRLQVNKEKYKSLGNGFKLTVQESGASGLFLGWAPTAIGYSMQGAWILSYIILLMSSNNQISEFRIPNIYYKIFVLIFFNDSENTFWGFYEI